MTNPYDSEVAFISGVGAEDRVVPVSFGTWEAAGMPVPPGYSTPVANVFKWGSATPGTTAAITYAFDSASGWTPGEQAAFQGGMLLWEAIANVTFAPATSAATTGFTIVRTLNSGAEYKNGSFIAPPIGSSTIGQLTPGDPASILNFDTANYAGDITSFASKKGFGVMTVLHELGHVLGLGHGGAYNVDNDAMVQQFGPYDSKLWSLMSYISPNEPALYAGQYPVTGTDWQGYEPTTPMMLDILAVQRLYGTATSGPLTGDGHVFGFHTNIAGPVGAYFNFAINTHPIVTLWATGQHNTLDLSGFAQDATIDLHPGTFSSAGGLKNNIGIAFGVTIDTAIGGSGKDTLIGAHDDTLTGGPGADKIYVGAGHNVLSDTLANMDGDTAYNFGQADLIRFTHALVGHDNLTVTPDHEGDTIVGVGDDDLLLVGTFTGGEFMASARNFGADGLHTDVQFVPYLPQLLEGVGVSANAVNGITNTSFLTGDGVVKFSATEQASVSAFDNSIGYYTVDAEGRISNVTMLFGDTHGSVGQTANLSSIANGLQVAFFLVQDGFHQFGTLPHDLGFVTQNGQAANANAGQPIFLDSASLGLLNATVFHSIQALNPGGANQVLSGVTQGGHDLQIGFEDLPRATGDNDFQDVVIQIHTDRDGVLVLG